MSLPSKRRQVGSFFEGGHEEAARVHQVPHQKRISWGNVGLYIYGYESKLGYPNNS